MALPAARKEVTDRSYRVFTYQPVDRVPDVEFGYWPQTIRRWLGEGLPAEFESEKNQYFSEKLDKWFGFENEGVGIDLRLGMDPPFEEEVLERREHSVVMRDTSGVVAERYLNDVDESSIPRFIRFPVERPEDWKLLKQRFAFDGPVRQLNAQSIQDCMAAARQGRMVRIGLVGFYGQLRNWMGTENLSLAFYDYPEMIHDMVEHWAELMRAPDGEAASGLSHRPGLVVGGHGLQERPAGQPPDLPRVPAAGISPRDESRSRPRRGHQHRRL